MQDAANRPLSRVLFNLAHSPRARISLGDLSSALSDRGFAGLIILFAAPNLVPMPPGTSTVFGIPLILVAIQLVVGRPRVWLPAFLHERTIDRDSFKALARRLAPILRRFERLARPRYWPVPESLAERFVGLVVLALGIVLIAPIPFGNWAPGVAVTILALALVARDGLWLAGGAAVAAGAFAIVAGVVGSIGVVAAAMI